MDTNGKPFTATNQMDFHNQALDAYEARLDQQIEENKGYRIASLHMRRTALSAGQRLLPRWRRGVPRGNDRGPA